MHPHLCATQLAAFTCRLWPNPLMGLQHSTHFSYRGTVTAKRHGRHDVYAWTPVLIQAAFNSQPNLRFLIKHNCHQLKKRSLFSYNVDSSNLLERKNKCSIKFIFSANTLSHLFPVPPSPQHPTFLSFSTIKYFSRWFGFNNSRSWWGHSCRANTGTGSSICL